jgi:hypothetical protein
VSRSISIARQAPQFQTGGLQIGAREDCRDTRRRLGLGRVDAGDLRMGMRAAQQVSLELPGPVDIVSVGALAREEAQVFLAPDCRPNAKAAHGSSLR